MNVLYVGPYRQRDSMGLTSRNHLKAISAKYNNLTARPIYFRSHDQFFNDQKILELEYNSYETYDIVIQHTIPGCLFRNKAYKKNIGIISVESHNLNDSQIISNINTMDEIWVSTNYEKNILIKSGVSRTIKIIPPSLDIDLIKTFDDHKLEFHPIVNNMFKFYFIGEYLDRKNIEDLIVSFNLAFSYDEPVCLVLKTGIDTMNPIQSKKVIEEDIQKIKKKLRIGNKYKQEIIITDYLSYKDKIGLHNACDCFISPSYGESFCKSAIEAMILGKTPIFNTNTAMRDYLDDSCAFPVKSHKTPVIVSNGILGKDFDTPSANEYWYKIDIYDLIDKMTEIYKMHKSKDIKLTKKIDQGKLNSNIFSFEETGKKICT
jgi:glycosyltransferase involved in cell wall biosynthesis